MVDVEWRIGSTHDYGARGPEFDSHPDSDGFNESLISLLTRHQTDLKTNSITCNLWCNVEINNINILIYYQWSHEVTSTEFLNNKIKNDFSLNLKVKSQISKLANTQSWSSFPCSMSLLLFKLISLSNAPAKTMLLQNCDYDPNYSEKMVSFIIIRSHKVQRTISEIKLPVRKTSSWREYIQRD